MDGRLYRFYEHLMEFGGVRFTDNFTNAYSPADNNSHLNAFNNWNWWSSSGAPSYCGVGTSNPFFSLGTSQIFSTATGSGYNWSYTNLNRNLEGYNVHRDFDLQFKYRNLMGQSNNGNPQSSCAVSIGGDIATNTLWGLCGGLEFRGYTIGHWTSSGSLQVLNNGSVIGTPYSGNIPRSNAIDACVFIQKRGNQVGVTVNTTGVKPSNPAFTYTITDFTELSNSLIMYQSTQGAGDDIGQSCMGNLDIMLF